MHSPEARGDQGPVMAPAGRKRVHQCVAVTWWCQGRPGVSCSASVSRVHTHSTLTHLGQLQPPGQLCILRCINRSCHASVLGVEKLHSFAHERGSVGRRQQLQPTSALRPPSRLRLAAEVRCPS